MESDDDVKIVRVETYSQRVRRLQTEFESAIPENATFEQLQEFHDYFIKQTRVRPELKDMPHMQIERDAGWVMFDKDRIAVVPNDGDNHPDQTVDRWGMEDRDNAEYEKWCATKRGDN